MKNKILVTGGNGMLGKSLKKYFPKATYLNGRKDLDFTSNNTDILVNSLGQFDYIIHCAAITDLNYCEIYPQQAYDIHVKAVKLLQKKTNKLIYISTNPIQSKKVYYITKKMGEEITLKRENDLVIRTNIIGDGGLVKWALDNLKKGKKIKGFSNVIFNPIHVDQLSKFIFKNIEKYKGVLNLASLNHISKYNFLKFLASKYKIDSNLIQPIKVNGDTDLTIPFENQYFKFNLMDGLKKIQL